ncbi:coiled-coil domain-containing protein 25 [Taeniopygia guttata]|uniref:Coiled-coil domain-containing protein 25 n=1 Tax=Taeniopygia guttata TaxID=59729 RepID=B5FXW7_TAEGU|nr:coiled-coil domain-containing protein 25 [Taeniopygia guttata]ACH43878.1 putative RIKEN cDNA 2610528H13 [Taeniopygia guttata]
MVFYFTSNAAAAPYTIYMGKDKYENEDLIKHGWPEDVCFHVDKLSSAHVYLRLQPGQGMDDIPKEVLSDCAHLVKANSIQGCKLNSVTVVYTPWTNLRKSPDMDVGEVGFHRSKEVRSVRVERRAPEQLRRLERTRVERFPDLAAERLSRDRRERGRQRQELREQRREQRLETQRKREMEELRSYSSLMKAENMSSNQDGNDSDDFM